MYINMHTAGQHIGVCGLLFSLMTTSTEYTLHDIVCLRNVVHNVNSTVSIVSATQHVGYVCVCIVTSCICPPGLLRVLRMILHRKKVR